MGYYGRVSFSLNTALDRLARSYRVDVVYAFGSRGVEVAGSLSGLLSGSLSGAQVPSDLSASDIDIGVQPQRGHRLTARERVRLTLELAGIFKTSRVDLVVLPEANVFLAAEVVRGELLYARDLDEESALQLYYLRRAGDVVPFFRERWLETVGSDL